ncbi:MAG: mobile mystery protein B [Candidatus Margulisiibacteriota bacterium]|jgi:Fic-DOC domain mobile mystery protein B
MNFQKVPVGATPINDISELIPIHITTLDELYSAEFKNISLATSKYLLTTKLFCFDLTSLYKVHFDMFSKVWKWAGKKRKVNLNIGSDKNYIDIDLKYLLDDIIFWEKNKEDAINISAKLYHRLVKIHPFINGNGRWSRLITNIYLKKTTKTLLTWPESNLILTSDFRNIYIINLKKADSGDYEPLINLHKELFNSNFR